MKKVLDFVQRFDLLPRYELLLAAASGGMDSMCLLDFLYENGYRVCAAHYNHQLRGQAADMDEDLVRAWFAARRIPLCVGTGDVAAYAEENGLAVEEAAVGRIADEGFDPLYGARPLRRVIRAGVEDAVAELLLSGTLHAGDAARIAAEDGALRVRREEPSIPAAAET